MLQFNSNSDNALKDFYTILGDVLVEDNENIVFQLSAAPSEVDLIPDRDVAVVTIIDDDCKTESSDIVYML